MITRHIEESIRLQKDILADQNFLNSCKMAAGVVFDCLRRGGKVLIAGNGGSAAQAQHFAAEFVGKYDTMERPAHSALALNTDTSILTAWSNDYQFDLVFARQIEAHGRSGDVFIAISTSGNSKNIITGLRTAKERGIATISFSGKGGGKAKGLADVEIIVPSARTSRIQEIQSILIHAITEDVEERLHGGARTVSGPETRLS